MLSPWCLLSLAAGGPPLLGHAKPSDRRCPNGPLEQPPPHAARRSRRNLEGSVPSGRPHASLRPHPAHDQPRAPRPFPCPFPPFITPRGKRNSGFVSARPGSGGSPPRPLCLARRHVSQRPRARLPARPLALPPLVHILRSLITYSRRPPLRLLCALGNGPPSPLGNCKYRRSARDGCGPRFGVQGRVAEAGRGRKRLFADEAQTGRRAFRVHFNCLVLMGMRHIWSCNAFLFSLPSPTRKHPRRCGAVCEPDQAPSDAGLWLRLLIGYLLPGSGARHSPRAPIGRTAGPRMNRFETGFGERPLVALASSLW